MSDTDNIILFPVPEQPTGQPWLDLPQGIRHYLLTPDREPVRVLDAMTWSAVLQKRVERASETRVDPWRVGYTKITEKAYVSTVFLGIDHDFSGKGPPILFETMVFTDGEPVTMKRCATWEEAERHHERAVKIARAGIQVWGDL